MKRSRSSLVGLVLLLFAVQVQASEIVSGDTVLVTVATRQASLSFTLNDLMRLYKIPGASVAVVEGNRLTWAGGFGVMTAGAGRPVTTATLFQAASISKPITAAGALWLVEHGRLELDRDVNQQLKSWKVPESALTAKEKVTLRRLMSHSAGLNVHGFAGYAQGAALPSTVQTLDGVAPANNAAVRVIAEPGTACIYSGGGIVVEGLLMKEASGQSFEQFMRRRVLEPAGMRSSTFEQALPPALARLAATGTHSDGATVAGGWHLYPELAPDGLWTTPSDLARFGIELSLSREGRANHILSQAMTRQMLTPACHDTPGDAGGIGLGFGVGYGGHPGQYRHTGGNDGFESLLFMDADAGWGIALMGNSDGFHNVYWHIVDAVARQKGWQYPARRVSQVERLTLIASRMGVPAALQELESACPADAKGSGCSETLNGFGYQLLALGQSSDAIRVFQKNVALHPEDANAYDSLAEGYMRAGDKSEAIRNYERSLQLNPGNENARRQLKSLRP